MPQARQHCRQREAIHWADQVECAMIFRCFLQRFHQQQWGAIATELVIVIIGVFIGMQASNRNEERETAPPAAVSIER